MKTYHFSRCIKADSTYDLVVVGGGMAGTAAAVCAARLGVSVLLIEATGCLGGMGTSGLVTVFAPMSDGKRMLVGGFMEELVENMYRLGYLKPGIHPTTWRKDINGWTPFRVEGLKILLDEYIHNSGAELRFFSKLIDVEADKNEGRIKGIVTYNVEGFEYIRAKTFIDATGDAVLSSLCGVSCCEPGKDTLRAMPSTLPSLFANINWNKFGDQQEAIHQAVSVGFFTQPDLHLPGMYQVGKTLGVLNGGHIFNLNPLKIKDLSQGMMLGRKIAQEYLEFYKNYVSGCEQIEHVVTASLMGVRESRRIKGEYVLNIVDYLNRRKFLDQIGIYNRPVDIHPYECTEEEYIRYVDEYEEKYKLRVGEYFGIPYGILVPKNWKNLWVAGRCNSSDIKVHGVIRVMPAAVMMGQAAASAAVQSIFTGQTACDLDMEMLVRSLRDNGAYLPQKETSKNMTRS